MLGVGVPLHADPGYLDLAGPLLEDDADYFEINPETLWRSVQGALSPNEFHPLFREIRDRSGKPFVAHGLGFSLGSGDPARSEAWLGRLRRDQAEFEFPWLTEHLGWTEIDGLHAALPLPLPFTEETIAVVADRIRLLRGVVPVVGVENTADAFALGDLGQWPAFINSLCRRAGAGLLLDLHNLYTQCLNGRQDPIETLDRLDLDSVLQIHVSGGSESDPGWLPSGRIFRLDSHDGAVPEPVWRLYERARPRCRNLRGVVVERLDGSFGEADVPILRAEVRRAKEVLAC